ncbi:MAG: 50S ribosomal protein L31 [Candidatus Izemoplasmatales bacterium]|jgi:large subunit ribosomal protein L31|nr:50S ribosomal protein L31 [Candidatus Izemoplasmatales bacterium]
MKTGIHPKYQTITVTCSTCGNSFETGSTAKEIKVDTCSNCHPFYTGKQKSAQAAGRIDKFNKRYGIDETENK